MVANSKQQVQIKNAVAISNANKIGRKSFLESKLPEFAIILSNSKLFHIMIKITAAPSIYSLKED